MPPRQTIVAAILLLATVSANAQIIPDRSRDRDNRQLNRQPVIVPGDLKGTIEGIMPGVLVVRDTQNMPWQVAVQGAKVEVTGTATADFLKTGMTVELTGTVDGHLAVKEKVSEMKIVTPSHDNPSGLFPAAGAEESSVAPDNGKASKSTKRPSGTKTAKQGAVTPGKYRIVGKLVVERGEKLTVQTGRNKVSLQLAENPKIDVAMSDLYVAAKGDRISAKGMQTVKMVKGQPVGQFKAAEVKVELAEPVEGIKKSPAARPEPKRPPKRDKAA